ncbi:AAA family ATPase [Actinoplanes xinjiangensis]|uniref:Uridine kinase n=1 Tax=Actinoplanes xinjiangensis TaxID=512350 RepID=A0A316EIM0_9ACTN|nr:AAA family ATPase [Actinoplanes xinjiangensis]PWK31518.1 uridine kinase [Actinoplanes xinjiangensis]GIF44032.1 adenylate kinase [Actinoplanes xinjiangensis]
MRNPITRPLPAPAGPPHDLSDPSALGEAVTTVVNWARATPPDGRRRVIAVEGRSGAGKTTLAGGVAERLGAPLIHMDDLYAGWDGLRQGVDALRAWVLEPLAEGRRAVWRRFDWAAGAYAEEHPVPDGDWLVVEGVGAGGRVLRPYLWRLVWVDAPTAERRRRALARDGETYAPHWDRWARQEDAFYAADQVRANADLIVGNPGA